MCFSALFYAKSISFIARVLFVEWVKKKQQQHASINYAPLGSRLATFTTMKLRVHSHNANELGLYLHIYIRVYIILCQQQWRQKYNAMAIMSFVIKTQTMNGLIKIGEQSLLLGVAVRKCMQQGIVWRQLKHNMSCIRMCVRKAVVKL